MSKSVFIYMNVYIQCSTESKQKLHWISKVFFSTMLTVADIIFLGSGKYRHGHGIYLGRSNERLAGRTPRSACNSPAGARLDGCLSVLYMFATRFPCLSLDNRFHNWVFVLPFWVFLCSIVSKVLHVPTQYQRISPHYLEYVVFCTCSCLTQNTVQQTSGRRKPFV